ncbi:MAG: peptidylprolyl isomerase [Pseudomonadota bacterium]
MAVIRKQSSRTPGRVLFRIGQVLALMLALAGTAAQANTIVRISTTYGDFSVELFDTVTPVTVKNFLNYVNRGAFNGSYFHRLEKGFVLQGGAYRFQPFVGPIALPVDAPIVNEFSVSNTRGTLAMAKLGGDPNSATNQWFVNLADNSANLDAQNGGFTAFGRVLGNGMTVLDTINTQAGVFSLGATHTTLPLANYEAFTVVKASNFITMTTQVVQRYSEALAVFESQSGKLMLTIDGGDALGVYSLHMALLADRPGVVLRLNPETMIALAIKPVGAATFTTADNKIRIPSLEVNNNGNLTVYKNVVLGLSNAQAWEFTLESFEQ